MARAAPGARTRTRTTSVSATTQRGNEHRRRAILEATLRLIGERGSSAVTHRSVAREAGVPLAATTYYFSSKEDLLEDALRLSAERELEELEELQAKFGGNHLSLEGWTRGLARVLAGETRGRRRTTLLAQYEVDLQSARRPALRRSVRHLNAAYARLAEPMLRSAGSPTPKADARLFVAAATGLLLEQLSTPSPRFEPDVFAPALLRLAVALTADGGRAESKRPTRAASRLTTGR